MVDSLNSLNSIERVDRCGEGGSGKLGIGFDLKMLLLLGYSAIASFLESFTIDLLSVLSLKAFGCVILGGADLRSKHYVLK